MQWTTNSTAEICKQSVDVCDYENEPGVNNWLYTQYIEYLDSKEVFIEVTYDLSVCRNSYLCSESYITLYYHGTNGSCPEEQTDSTNYQYIGRIYWWGSTYTARLERPTVQTKDFILVFETLEHVELSVELECTTKCVQVKLMV